MTTGREPQGVTGPERAPGPEPDLPPDLDIEDVPAASRYEARLGDRLAGWVDYRRMGAGERPRLVAIHTEVLPEFGGRGIGSALVRRVIADARAAGATVSPLCPLFVSHFERHPEDADLLVPGRQRRGDALG